ncbi:MAG TPA: cobalamin biosynthesis protein [Mycobacterium sp.]|nr:cobalamin biosynthesis protein [Mycobacterium sp.]
MFARRRVGLLAGWVADLVFADPRRWHPVGGFGAVAGALERVVYRDSRWAGVAYVGAVLSVVLGLGVAVDRRRAGLAVATWTALGGRSLIRTVSALSDALADNDIEAARELVPSLCGRDPDALDFEGLVRAALESLAENTSDAHVAPLFWAAVGGAPGALVYRAVNTLDAMVGYRSPRYGRFGWAAARLDDGANLAPARLTAGLVVLCAPVVGGSPLGACRAWSRDARRHPSPNAGVVEAAFAGALGVRLGGPTRYPHGLEVRPVLGDGPAPGIGDLRRAVRLARVVQGAAAVVAIILQRRPGRSHLSRRDCGEIANWREIAICTQFRRKGYGRRRP